MKASALYRLANIVFGFCLIVLVLFVFLNRVRLIEQEIVYPSDWLMMASIAFVAIAAAITSVIAHNRIPPDELRAMRFHDPWGV